MTTEELEEQRHFWERRTQREEEKRKQYQEDRLQLNLQPNQDGLLECRGRIQGNYPIYLPDTSTFTRKLVQQAHEETLHGGVGLTMAKVRDRYWVPRLRRLTKKLVRSCYGCKRFQVKALQNPPPGNLPLERTVESAPFKIVGVDYAGPLKYQVYKKESRRKGLPGVVRLQRHPWPVPRVTAEHGDDRVYQLPQKIDSAITW